MLKIFDNSSFIRRETIGEFRNDVFGFNGQRETSFIHSCQVVSYSPSSGLSKHRTWFGPGVSYAAELFEKNLTYLQSVESLILKNSVFIPSTCSVYSEQHGFYEPSVEGFSENSQNLPNIDSIFINLSNKIEIDYDNLSNFSDKIAIPICGHGVTNYGHFLFDGLSAALMLYRILDSGRVVLIGPPLKNWQSDILEVLGVREHYECVVSATQYSTIIVTNMLSKNVAFPNRVTRALFDEIIFRVGTKPSTDRRILYISRRNAERKRNLINREEVDRTFAGWGFETVYPEELSFCEQVKVFSSAAIIAGESGAAMANIGFCQPGCRVLEIQPECFVEGWTRAMCLLFGHEWHVYFAKLTGIPEQESDNKNIKHHYFDYEVDIPELIEAIKCIRDRNYRPSLAVDADVTA